MLPDLYEFPFISSGTIHVVPDLYETNNHVNPELHDCQYHIVPDLYDTNNHVDPELQNCGTNMYFLILWNQSYSSGSSYRTIMHLKFIFPDLYMKPIM